MKSLVILLTISLFIFSANAQSNSEEKEYSNIAAIVFLDSFVVTAKKQGFNVDEFIEIVQEDESFYEAFRNLRKISYQSDNFIEFYNKKRRVKAQYKSQTAQTFEDNCRTMAVQQEESSGNFYKKNGEIASLTKIMTFYTVYMISI